MRAPEIQMGVHKRSGLKGISASEYSNFILVTLIGLLFAVVWLYVGEPWGLRGDASHYRQLYEGLKARSPFGYRILTPWLAQLFSSLWSYWVNFKIIAITCLSLTTGFIYLFAKKKKGAEFQIRSFVLFWVSSFAFAYYSTAIIRPDSLMFLLLAILFLVSNCSGAWWFLLLLLGVGVFVHETILIFIPALWLDKILQGKFTNGRTYTFRQLSIVTAGAIIVFVLSRKFIEVLPTTDPNYLNSPIEVIRYAVNYSGGMIKYVMRIYAAYGPSVIFSFFCAIFFLDKRSAASFFALFLGVVAASFLATDTLRMMAVISVPVFFYAARYVFEVWASGHRTVAFFLLALQLLYSFVVFGHLRTFEKSLTLNVVAALISIIAFLACAVITFKTFPRTFLKSNLHNLD